MKVICKTTDGYQFSRKDVKEGIVNRVNHKGLTVDKQYELYGMVIFQEGLDYLIYDDYEMPMWYSAELFEIEDSLLPNNWHHSFWGYDKHGVSSVWGYDELVKSREHFNGLAEQDEKEVSLFMKLKEEIDQVSTGLHSSTKYD